MNLRRLLIVGSIVAIVVAGGLAIWRYNQNSHFRLVSASPQDEAGTVAPIVFEFNRDLDRKTADSFTIDPGVQGSIQIEGDTFVFKPTGQYNLNVTYHAELSKVIALDGSVLDNVSVSFTTKLLQFNELSRGEQKEQERRTDIVERTNPFLAKLPYSTDHYMIDYQLTSTDSRNSTPDKFIYKVTLYATLNRPDQLQTYNADLRAYKQEALNWIKSQGVDPASLKIEYDPPVN